MKRGVNISIIKRAERLPYRVKIIAGYASPFSRNWWPGRTERKESSSGAPRKIEGM